MIAEADTTTAHSPLRDDGSNTENKVHILLDVTIAETGNHTDRSLGHFLFT